MEVTTMPMDVTNTQSTLASERLLGAQARILQQEAKTAELNDLLSMVCLEVEALLGEGAIASILLLDKDTLAHAAAPNLSPAYTTQVDGVKIGPKSGSCGRAAFLGERVIVADIAHDPLWQNYKALAAQFNLKSGWSTPFFSAAKTVSGTFAIYYQTLRSPSASELAAIDHFAILIGLLVEHAKNKQELTARAEQLLQAQYIAKMGNFTWNIQSGQVSWSQGMHKLLKYDADEAIDYAHVNTQIHHPDDLKQITQWLNTCFESGNTTLSPNEYRLICKNGDIIFVHTEGKIEYSEGKPLKLFGTCIDISALKQAEQALISSETKYRDLFEKSKDAILIVENGKFVDCNEAAVKMLGYQKKQQLLQVHPSKLSPLRQADGRLSSEKADEIIAVALAEGSYRFEWDHLKSDGNILPVEVILTTIRNEPDSQVIYTVWRDITLQKQQQEHILYQAHYDSLTGLPNRFLALDRLSQLISESHRQHNNIAVLFLDLDDFKKINDSLGHEAGDRLLVMAAQRLRKAVREGDTVARLGGDEFIIITGGLNKPEEAHSVAACLLEPLRDSFELDGHDLILTGSLGIACYPDDGTTAGELLRKADMAMHHAKTLGRNSYQFFTPTMNESVSRRLLLEENLHGALERKEFSLVYQPLIRISDRKIIGAEALLRWHNPTLGSVPPDEFIPITEQTGYIMQIGEFVLSEALAIAAKIQQRFDQSFKIAVNLSPRQFRDRELASKIESQLHLNALSGDALELEITEGVLLSGPSLIGEALTKMNKLGINMAMDDFGTGYSSLSYLRQYPFDTLKIDRSFIQDITLDPADRELVSAAIAMAHGLGLFVVAEGVETTEQLDHLIEQGCDFAQGYLFSKPVPAEEFMKLMDRGLL